MAHFQRITCQLRRNANFAAGPVSRSPGFWRTVATANLSLSVASARWKWSTIHTFVCYRAGASACRERVVELWLFIVLLVCRMEHVQSIVEPSKKFAKDSIRLVKKCTKPDRKGELLTCSFFLSLGACPHVFRTHTEEFGR